MEEQKVGFIGLGEMGQLMAGLLLDAGFPLTIWNRTTSKTVELGKRGAKVANSPKEVAAQSDITITMILDDAALEAVSFGENFRVVLLDLTIKNDFPIVHKIL